MKILVANAGSTSFKYRLFDTAEKDFKTGASPARGKITNIGYERSVYAWDHGKGPREKNLDRIDYTDAVGTALAMLKEDGFPDPDGVGFKTVHGGRYRGAERLTRDVIDEMREYLTVAPAHNRHYITVISVFLEKYPDLPLVGLFEPHFHTAIPPERRIYPAPYEWYAEHGVEKLGFHGASHSWISERVGALVPDARRVISCHLGGSSSICAILDGKSVDTSFGFSLQSGVVHSNRCGDLDAFVIRHMKKKLGISYDEVFELLCTEGGLRGISGMEGDMAVIEKEAEGGNGRAELALRKFVYDVQRYVGEYLVMLQGIDAVAFTGGIGENSVRVRREVCSCLSFMGMRLDKEANESPDGEARITEPGSSIQAWVIPANEELVVARETERVLSGTGR